jgi:hypothetical protein
MNDDKHKWWQTTDYYNEDKTAYLSQEKAQQQTK